MGFAENADNMGAIRAPMTTHLEPSPTAAPTISVVVPLYNEQDVLPELHRRLVAALDSTGKPWEILFVNDASKDTSLSILHDLHRADPRVRVLTFSRNFGHQPAITAGIHHSRGACTVVIDGDLQDPPELIPALVRNWTEGNQVVLAVRRSRADRGARGIGFRLFYPLMHWLSDLPGGPDAGVFSLLDRAVVEQFNHLPERNRFIPGLRSWLGFRTATVEYDRQDRAAGKPKQTLRRLFHYAADAIFSFSYKPLRVATYVGFLASVFSFLLAIYYFVTFFYFKKQAGSGFTTIIICTLFLGGVQLICLGILGEYVARIYEEVKQRPLYVVAEKLGFEDGVR